MAKTTTSNQTVKALISYLNQKRLNGNKEATIEYKMVSSNMRVGVINHSEFKKFYSRDKWLADGCGATKCVHTHYHGEEAESFEFNTLVVKRIRKDCYKNLGNQCIAEIDAWNEMCETPDADYLCPVLKYFTSKSDKVTEMSETMLNNVVIVAQKAVYISNLADACRKAEEMNRNNGFKYTPWRERRQEMCELASRKGWWDVEHNGGNSGVIFDYSQKCYKAVFVDYAL